MAPSCDFSFFSEVEFSRLIIWRKCSADMFSWSSKRWKLNDLWQRSQSNDRSLSSIIHQNIWMSPECQYGCCSHPWWRCPWRWSSPSCSPRPTAAARPPTRPTWSGKLEKQPLSTLNKQYHVSHCADMTKIFIYPSAPLYYASLERGVALIDTQNDSIQSLNFGKIGFNSIFDSILVSQNSIQTIIQFKNNCGDSIQ